MTCMQARVRPGCCTASTCTARGDFVGADARSEHEHCGKQMVVVAKVCVFITAGPIIKLCAGGEGDSEEHVL